MSIFKKIKAETDFLTVVEHYIGPLKQCGDNTYTTEEDECPIHGGHGCFRIKVDGEESMLNCFGNCDHDEWPMDIISFVQVYKDLETVGEAARLIAKDFNISMPVENASNKIIREAQEYYRGLFEFGSKKLKGLGKRTPKEYQLEVRHHKEETLDAMQIGWSDGALIEHLEDDFTREELLGSGLIKEFKGKLVDVLPSESFIYPHVWSGVISRFSFKHMPTKGKVLSYQMKKDKWLNNIEFYAVGSGTPVAIVEGENDLAALLDDGWEGTILCTNGSFGKTQIEWLEAHPTEYHTFWDGDDAGLKYADKIWKSVGAGRLKDVHQWALPQGSDIDTFLKEHDITDLKCMAQPDRDDLIDVREKDSNTIREEGGCYKICILSKDGEAETRVPISDFVIKLLYVKVQGDERSRVIRIIRNDGRKSKPVTVNSEAKVSLRHWKILVANAVDASFTGSELDLAAMWSYIYSRQREAVVDVPPYVGAMESGEGWIVGNQYIGLEGDIQGDDDNIMWFDKKKTRGVAPKSLMATLSSTASTADIPMLSKGEDTEEFIGEVILNLNSILKDPGIVLAIMGWLRSCAYSMPLFYDAKLKFFPFLVLWGKHGKGKSTLANWMLSMYDMADKGTTTVGQLRSGVGIERKLAYYRGLPYCIDELRADKQAMDYSKAWRGWYNRSSRVKGTRKSEEIIQVPLNSCLFFSGQDTFADPAMRSRCIPIKFPINAGDDLSYNWLEEELDDFPTIGYHWVREAMDRCIHEVKDEMDVYKTGLREMAPDGIPSRALANYALVGYFSQELADKYFPEFDYRGWLINAMAAEHVEAVENDMVAHFWEGVAGLQIGERPLINGNHVLVKNNQLFIWFAEAYKVVSNSNRGEARESFSRTAVRDSLKEEAYYAGETTQRMGATQTGRRCLKFNLDARGLPQELQAVAETSRASF